MQTALSSYLSEKIAAARKEKGVKQGDLAKRLNINRTTMSNIEAGRQIVMIDLLYRICEQLGVDVIDMMPTMEWFGLNKNKTVKRVVAKFEYEEATSTVESINL